MVIHSTIVIAIIIIIYYDSSEFSDSNKDSYWCLCIHVCFVRISIEYSSSYHLDSNERMNNGSARDRHTTKSNAPISNASSNTNDNSHLIHSILLKNSILRNEFQATQKFQQIRSI